jgi:hypothetical protein
MTTRANWNRGAKGCAYMATLAIYDCVRAVEHKSGAVMVKCFLCFYRVRHNRAEKQDNGKHQLE